MWLGFSITGRPAVFKRRLSARARSWWLSRSAALALRCLMLATAPAAIAGASDVVKMNPGA